MAFDGPSPFDGDPAFEHAEEMEDASPDEVRAALKEAFDEVLDPDEEYIDVDETVWAWAAAELVALAIGKPSDPPPPEPFAAAAKKIPDPHGLIESALAALEVVADEERSEVAELWADIGEDPLAEHLDDLRSRLER